MEKFDAFVAKVATTNNPELTDDELAGLPNPRVTGPMYLEKDEYFIFHNEKRFRHEDEAMRRTNADGSVSKVFYLDIEMCNADGTSKGANKRIYLNSFCKTVYGWGKDDDGNAKRLDGGLGKGYITTTGDVADLCQRSNWTEFLNAISGKLIHVSDVHTIQTKKFNADKNAPIEFHTGSTFDLNFVKK